MEEVKFIYDYSRLTGRIKEKYGTQEEFAKALGMGRVSLSQRLNNRLEFRQSEIKSAILLLEIPKDRIAGYFFTAIGTRLVEK